MKDFIITFKTAKLAKEKGFNIPTNLYYYCTNNKIVIDNGDGDFEGAMLNHNLYDDYFSAPTQSLLQKWLRDKHKIHIELHYGKDKIQIWYEPKLFSLIKPTEGRTDYDDLYESLIELDQYYNYEEAFESGLENALNLIWKRMILIIWGSCLR